MEISWTIDSGVTRIVSLLITKFRKSQDSPSVAKKAPPQITAIPVAGFPVTEALCGGNAKSHVKKYRDSNLACDDKEDYRSFDIPATRARFDTDVFPVFFDTDPPI